MVSFFREALEAPSTISKVAWLLAHQILCSPLILTSLVCADSQVLASAKMRSNHGMIWLAWKRLSDAYCGIIKADSFEDLMTISRYVYDKAIIEFYMYSNFNCICYAVNIIWLPKLMQIFKLWSLTLRVDGLQVITWSNYSICEVDLVGSLQVTGELPLRGQFWLGCAYLCWM